MPFAVALVLIFQVSQSEKLARLAKHAFSEQDRTFALLAILGACIALYQFIGGSLQYELALKQLIEARRIALYGTQAEMPKDEVLLAWHAVERLTGRRRFWPRGFPSPGTFIEQYVFPAS